MNDRLLVYPLLLVTILPFVFLLRNAARCLLIPILRHLVVLTAGVVAIFTGDVALAWGLFLALILLPRFAYSWAGRYLQAGQVVWANRLRQVARFGVKDPVTSENLPAFVRGELRLWQLWTLTGTRHWAQAIELYEATATWGLLNLAMPARLAVARAYAETGQFDRAVRNLVFVALSPRIVGALEREYLEVRTLVVNTPEFELLRHAEEQTAAWRRLLSWRPVGRITAGLVAILGTIFIIDLFTGTPLYLRFGNQPFNVSHGEWYRPVTALFLHAGWEHLLMNAAAVWVFGTAIEKSWGAGRMLVCFLLAGTAANCVSASFGSFDVSVGASGGVFGLVGAFGVAVYRLRAPAQAGLRRQLLRMLGVLVATDFVIGGLEPRIDNLAHAGGFIAGIGFAVLLAPRIVDERRGL
ncbi:MAG: rhomboid family intramembrane serine protease [Verrucomicrobiota bacterium]